MKAGFLKSWLTGVGVCTESDDGKNAASRHASARGANCLNITGASDTNQQLKHFYIDLPILRCHSIAAAAASAPLMLQLSGMCALAVMRLDF